jgi:hypothetical protein
MVRIERVLSNIDMFLPLIMLNYANIRPKQESDISYLISVGYLVMKNL